MPEGRDRKAGTGSRRELWRSSRQEAVFTGRVLPEAGRPKPEGRSRRAGTGRSELEGRSRTSGGTVAVESADGRFCNRQGKTRRRKGGAARPEPAARTGRPELEDRSRKAEAGEPESRRARCPGGLWRPSGQARVREDRQGVVRSWKAEAGRPEPDSRNRRAGRPEVRRNLGCRFRRGFRSFFFLKGAGQPVAGRPGTEGRNAVAGWPELEVGGLWSSSWQEVVFIF